MHVWGYSISIYTFQHEHYYTSHNNATSQQSIIIIVSLISVTLLFNNSNLTNLSVSSTFPFIRFFILKHVYTKKILVYGGRLPFKGCIAKLISQEDLKFVCIFGVLKLVQIIAAYKGDKALIQGGIFMQSRSLSSLLSLFFYFLGLSINTKTVMCEFCSVQQHKIPAHGKWVQL